MKTTLPHSSSEVAVPISLAILLATVSMAAALTCVVVLAVTAVRPKGSLVGRRGHAADLLAPAVGLAISTVLPWVGGRAVGVNLPRTLWGLPEVRWIVLVTMGAYLVVALATIYIRSPYSRLFVSIMLTCMLFVSSVMLVMIVIGHTVTHIEIVNRLILKGLQGDSTLLPTVSVGWGAPAAMLSCILGLIALTVRELGAARRGTSSTAPTSGGQEGRPMPSRLEDYDTPVIEDPL